MPQMTSPLLPSVSFDIPQGLIETNQMTAALRRHVLSRPWLILSVIPNMIFSR